MPEWRERSITNYKKALSFLEEYRWSSYMDYVGKKNFPSVTQREFLTEFLGGPSEHRANVKQWLKDIDFARLEGVVLE